MKICKTDTWPEWPCLRYMDCYHYDDVTMSLMASQITSLTIVYPTVYSGVDQREHQSSASLAFVRGIHWGLVNSPHKWPVTRKMFPFDDVIMMICYICVSISFQIEMGEVGGLWYVSILVKDNVWIWWPLFLILFGETGQNKSIQSSLAWICYCVIVSGYFPRNGLVIPTFLWLRGHRVTWGPSLR